MKIRLVRFNTYLLALLLGVAVGCQTAASKRKKQLSTLGLHLEVNPDGTAFNKPVPIFRDQPFLVNVEQSPFVDGRSIVRASVVDWLDSFYLRIEFDRRGTWLLDNVTSSNPGKRVAVHCQFEESRWLAAPVISQRITDGVFIFTPDATHDEAERIVRGLNNVARKIKKGRM